MINDTSYYGKNPATGLYAWTTTAQYPKATCAELTAATDSDFESGEKPMAHWNAEEYPARRAAYVAKTEQMRAARLARRPQPAPYLLSVLD